MVILHCSPLGCCKFDNDVSISLRFTYLNVIVQVLLPLQRCYQALPQQYEWSQMPHFKFGPVCVSRPGHDWHSGHFEGLILQCKETAGVRPLPDPQQPDVLYSPVAASGLFTLCLCYSAAPNQSPTSLLILDRQENKGSYKNKKNKNKNFCFHVCFWL